MKKVVFYKILYLLFLFLVGALICGILEICYQLLTKGSFKLGGFLYGPIRPIYGWGTILLHLIGSKFNKNIIVTFIASFIICSIFEYLSSYILYVLFNRTWWDYSGFPFNINGRICLPISICFGILGVIFIKGIEPILRFIYIKSNKKILFLIIIITFIIYKIDGTISLIQNIDKVK